MKPEDIEQMKRDRAAGADRWPNVVTTVYLGDGRAEMVILLGPVIPEPEKTIPTVRRVFRVPTLEAEVLRLREALERIGKLSPEPDDKQWYDDWGDPCEYRFVGRDGLIFTNAVDTSNSGDVSSHAYERGVHSAAVIARRALNGDAP